MGIQDANPNPVPPLAPPAQAAPGGPLAQGNQQAPISLAAVHAAEMESRYGTFLQWTFPDLSDKQLGFWWRRRMPEVRFAMDDQVAKGYELIRFNPNSPHTMFISPRNAIGATNPRNVTQRDGTRMSLNEYLSNLLREYKGLLVETLRLNSDLIANSTFLILTTRP